MNSYKNKAPINHNPFSAKKPAFRFNWRGNRLRMGKRAMCPECRFLLAGQAIDEDFVCVHIESSPDETT